MLDAGGDAGLQQRQSRPGATVDRLVLAKARLNLSLLKVWVLASLVLGLLLPGFGGTYNSWRLS